jgi:2-polyprenyl-3-methyl-5-hydroxy-6-metoxy-1,4-benzoquinol methylase
MDNQHLRQFYENIYLAGEENYFSKFKDGKSLSQNDEMVLKTANWVGKTVLDVGCGTGDTVALIALAGAKFVTGIDYAPEAIAKARRKHHQLPNVEFKAMALDEWSDGIDIIISCGTIEHMDKPWEAIQKMAELLPAGGEIVLTCPHFINIRGFIWMTLYKLFKVPMSLTDVHFIAPFDLQNWIKNTSLELVYFGSFDNDEANGEKMLTDMRKRLTNALRDANMDNSKVDDLISWLDSLVVFQKMTGRNLGLEGRNALYHLKKR